MVEGIVLLLLTTNISNIALNAILARLEIKNNLSGQYDYKKEYTNLIRQFSSWQYILYPSRSQLGKTSDAS